MSNNSIFYAFGGTENNNFLIKIQKIKLGIQTNT